MDGYTMVTQAVRDLGFPIAVTAYLLYRDWRFMGAMTALMGRIDSFLESSTPEAKKVG